MLQTETGRNHTVDKNFKMAKSYFTVLLQDKTYVATCQRLPKSNYHIHIRKVNVIKVLKVHIQRVSTTLAVDWQFLPSASVSREGKGRVAIVNLFQQR